MFCLWYFLSFWAKTFFCKKNIQKLSASKILAQKANIKDSAFCHISLHSPYYTIIYTGCLKCDIFLTDNYYYRTHVARGLGLRNYVRPGRLQGVCHNIHTFEWIWKISDKKYPASKLSDNSWTHYKNRNVKFLSAILVMYTIDKLSWNGCYHLFIMRKISKQWN